jgi:hypothetical protein
MPGTPLEPVRDGADGVIGSVRTLAWIVVLTMVGAAPLAGCGADREEDEQQILHELPTFPGARELEVGTAP